MKVYLVRHGEAVALGEDGCEKDAERHLTSKGGKRVAQVAKGLAAMGIEPFRVATSPLVRAEETAHILAARLCPDAPLEVCPFLIPDGLTADLVAWLAEKSDDSMILVGHMPGISHMASELISPGSTCRFLFKKAGVCCIDFPTGPALASGTLEWLMQPQALRRLVKGKRKNREDSEHEPR